MTNTKFDDNSGAFYLPSAIDGRESPEFHDAKYFNSDVFYTSFIPINSVTTFQVNQQAPGGSTNFITLTAAADEINIDPQTGRISIINSSKYPAEGPRQVKVTYTFGRANTPKDITMLAIVMTGLRMMGATFIKNKMLNFDEITLTDLESIEAFKNRIIRKYRNFTIAPT